MKGLVGLTHIVEKLSMCGDDFDVFQWSMDFMITCILWRYKEVYEEGRHC